MNIAMQPLKPQLKWNWLQLIYPYKADVTFVWPLAPIAITTTALLLGSLKPVTIAIQSQ